MSDDGRSLPCVWCGTSTPNARYVDGVPICDVCAGGGPADRGLDHQCTDEFEVTVPAGVQTRLPNGQYVICGGTMAAGGTMTGNFTVRGFMSDQGPVVEVAGYESDAKCSRQHGPVPDGSEVTVEPWWLWVIPPTSGDRNDLA